MTRMTRKIALAAMGGLAALITATCQGETIPPPNQIREVPTAIATAPRRTIELPDLLYAKPGLLSGVKSELPINNSFPSEGGWQLVLYAVQNPQQPFTSSLSIGHIVSHNKLFLQNGVYAPPNQLITSNGNIRHLRGELYNRDSRKYEFSDPSFPILLRISTGSPLEESTLTLQMGNGVELPVYLPSFSTGEACLLAGKDGSTYRHPSCSSADLQPAPDYHIELARQAPPAANQQ